MLQFGNHVAAAATVEFTGTVAGSPGMRLWPQAIVSFADQAILPVGEMCGADCSGLSIAKDGEPARHELVRVRGQGLAALVRIEPGLSRFTACVPAQGCMRFEVRRELMSGESEP